MNRQQWKDLLEGIGLLAIVASLVFVGIETRNSTKQSELNTQALEIAAYQALMNNIDDMNKLSLESPLAAPVLMELWDDESEDVQEFQKARALYLLFRHGDLAFFMYERGAIDEDRLLSALAPLPISTKDGREFWEAKKGSFTKNYRNYVDWLIAKSGRPKDRDTPKSCNFQALPLDKCTQPFLQNSTQLMPR